MDKFYITTPIYYVNDVPHIGHAYTTVAADTIARWYRLHDIKVFFLTGTDEHGTKILEAAKLKNKPVTEYCNEIADKFKQLWLKLNISNDYFIRTTEESHEQAVKFFLKELIDRNQIYKSKYRGLYCNQCENFLTESELVNNLCPVHSIKPIERFEENYFFKLSNYREKLIEIISDSANENHLEIQPQERKNEILGKLNLSLEDISISRANMDWGIPLPFDSSQTTYVWIDALINYISAIGYGRKVSEATEINFNELWPANIHLIGKDILWFHTVIWPALLLAVGLSLPKKVYAHGYFTINGKKMSKTIGNVIYPVDLINKFGVDATRYLILSAFPFGTDGDFSFDNLKEKYNNDLANNLGNLVSRVMKMIEKFTNSEIPKLNKQYNNPLISESELESIKESMNSLEFYNVIGKIQKSINTANRYIDNSMPWNLAKQQKLSELNNVLYNLSETLWIIAHYIYPFMPTIAQNIFNQLGQTVKIENSSYFIDKRINIEFNNKVKITGIIFPRI